MKNWVQFVCSNCGQPCSRKQTSAARFCSTKCYHEKRSRGTISLFWSRIQKSENCWNWIGKSDKDGYGFFCLRFPNGHEQRAHRVSWVIHFGKIPEGKWVLHRCDNPSCVNPHHLFIGDAAKNNQDMVNKGRAYYPSGEDAGQSKLTNEQVVEIRRRANEEGRGIQRRLAKEFGVGYKAISKIVLRQRWVHL